MLYISLFDIIPEAHEYISEGDLWLYFFFGVLIMFFIDYLFPDDLLNYFVKNIDKSEPTEMALIKKRSLLKAGIVTFTGMALHNFPEVNL
jgi:zinc transporter ZupT